MTSMTQVEWLIRTGTTFEDATPNLPAAQWNVAPGGWTDLQNDPTGAPLTFGATQIFPAVSCGGRFLNVADPVAGLTMTDLGSMSMPYYPELMHPLWDITLGTTNKVITPTAGTAAAASGLLTGLAALDTQPDSEEVLIFTVTEGAGSSVGIIIDVIQGGVTVEQLSPPDVVATPGIYVYQTKGAYDGTTNPITFSVAGTSTATVAVSGVQYFTTQWQASPTSPPGVIEQIGRVEVDFATNSQFATGVTIPSMGMNFDRNANDGLLMFEPTIGGNYAGAAAKNACANDAAKYFKFIAAWNAVLTIDGTQNFELQTFSLSPNTQDEYVQVATGSQGPRAKEAGLWDVSASITLIPEDKTRFDNYLNATPEDWKIVFSTPKLLNGAQPWVVELDMSRAFYETYTPGNSSMSQSADGTIRMVRNDDDAGPFMITHIDRRGQ